MAMFQSTMPALGDDLRTTLQKACQILDTGAVGPDTPVPYPDPSPVAGDDLADSARKFTQLLHLNWT